MENLKNYEEMQIALIMSDPKLQEEYKLLILEKIKLDKQSVKLNLLELKNTLKKEKTIDEDSKEYNNIVEDDLEMYPN